MKHVTISYDQEKQEVLITFIPSLEPFLVLFPDTRYLIEQCITRDETTLTLSKNLFEDFYFKRTIPVFIAFGDFEGNMKRIEYGLDHILSVLQRELSQDCEVFELLSEKEVEEEFERIKQKALTLIEKCYRYDLVQKWQQDYIKYQKAHPEGGVYHDIGSDGG